MSDPTHPAICSAGWRSSTRSASRSRKEKDINRLLEAILVAAKKITNADGGTLYRMHATTRTLRFEIMRTDSLGIAMGGTTGVEIPFYPIRLCDDEGRANNFDGGRVFGAATTARSTSPMPTRQRASTSPAPRASTARPATARSPSSPCR